MARFQSLLLFFFILLFIFLCSFLTPGLAASGFGQDAVGATAWVYVANTAANEVYAFGVAANGALTPVPGSPFNVENVASLTAANTFLFTTDGVSIYTFAIAGDGSISQTSSVNAQQYNPQGFGGPGALFADRTGATLYDQDYYCCGTDNAYQFFSMDPSSGSLTYLGVSDAGWNFYVPLSFVGNNQFAYGSECSMYSQIFGFRRNSDGTLTDLNITPSVPAGKGQYAYCPTQAVSDPANHVAIAFTPEIPPAPGKFSPPPQLGVYTADSQGTLTTTSTWANMPQTGVKTVLDVAISPSGKLIAVGGVEGLQIFHFNGADPITKYTQLLAGGEIDQFWWDNNNHLLAISKPGNKLYVLTVTPTSIRQASGSPYAIASPNRIAVLPIGN
jgi:hypothetical protein